MRRRIEGEREVGGVKWTLVEEFKVLFRVDLTSPGGVQGVRRATILGTIYMQVCFLNLEQEEVCLKYSMCQDIAAC